MVRYWAVQMAGKMVVLLVACLVASTVGCWAAYLAFPKAAMTADMLAAQRALRKVVEMAASRAGLTVVWTVDL